MHCVRLGSGPCLGILGQAEFFLPGAKDLAYFQERLNIDILITFSLILLSLID